MDRSRGNELLGQVDELDRRDRALAAMLAEIAALTDEVQALRQAADETVTALARLPLERASATDERAAARLAASAAARELALAEAAVADLERARKPRDEELERARQALRHALAEQSDATARVGRADVRLVEIDELEVALGAAAEGLVVTARSLAARLQSAPRVTDAGKGEPGTSVGELDEWGARARAALFVAHSTLATERERVLHEANAFGASVLGETAVLSVALVRQRLAERLAEPR